MTPSAAEIDRIVRAAADSDISSTKSRWAGDTRRLLSALADFEFETTRGGPLMKLGAAGARYGWRELQKNTEPELLANLSARASASLRRNLGSDLAEITRPCFDLEWKSFCLAMTSIGLVNRKPDPKSVERMFLGDRPSHRLLSLFRKFPVLARLWGQMIRQWHEHAGEVLARFVHDRRSLSRTFFANQPIEKISDARFGLSDRHDSGRTVVRLQFEAGSIIYKPRSGAGESEWFSLLEWMNRHGFRPKLAIAHLLLRKDYCWMEYVELASLRSETAAVRFYERMGGIIAAAHLLRAVDCHRDNLIASGEHPVLVDADALWHVSRGTQAPRSSDLLYRTGFFPNADPLSLHSRSSILGPGAVGNHVPRLRGRPLAAVHYQREMILGFARAWRCLMGTRKAREAFARRLRRIRSTERRWIHRATETYAAILEASIQPPAVRSGRERELLIRSRCARDPFGSAVADAEVRALKQLDIPYFPSNTNQSLPPDRSAVPRRLIKALSTALPSPR
jgi:class II lanthipeptide synthase